MPVHCGQRAPQELLWVDAVEAVACWMLVMCVPYAYGANIAPGVAIQAWPLSFTCDCDSGICGCSSNGINARHREAVRPGIQLFSLL